VYEELIWVNDFSFSGSQVQASHGKKPIVDAKKLAEWQPLKHSEDIYFTLAALRHPMRTMNASNAKIFVVPSVMNLILEQMEWSRQKYCWKNKCNAQLFGFYNNVLASSPWFQRHGGRDHLLVNSN
jgi:hypothetical protein